MNEEVTWKLEKGTFELFGGEIYGNLNFQRFVFQDSELYEEASLNQSKKNRKHAKLDRQKNDASFDDDDDSHYHHADQPSTSSQAKLSPRTTNSFDCSSSKKERKQSTTELCKKISEKLSPENEDDPPFCNARNLPLNERKENIAGLLNSLNNDGKKCKNLSTGKQEKGDVKEMNGSGAIIDPIASLDNLFDDDNDPCECPVCNSRGRTADELFADDDDFGFYPIKSSWVR